MVLSSSGQQSGMKLEAHWWCPVSAVGLSVFLLTP